MPTTYSNTNFLILKTTEDLQSGIYFGSNGNFAKVFDDDNMNDAGDMSSNCHIGMEFKQGFIGQISQVKFFLSNVVLTTFTNNLKFQGSNDKNNWSDLFSVDENVHEGWNYHKWNDAASYPKFRAYRFTGSAAGSCKINEIKFAGVKSRDDNNQNVQCDVKLYLDGAS